MSNLKACPVCNIAWEGKEIPDGLMESNPERHPTREIAEETAKHYGWTPENKATFGVNYVGIEYAWDDPNHYDGVSEWRCTACGTRIGRWSGKILGEDEVEKPFGRR